ncbi:MAG: transcription antitermination factor NusB [Pseudomonadota bacterium]
MNRPRPRRPVARRQEPPGLVARRAALKLLSNVLDRRGMLEDRAPAASGPERAEALGLADLTLRRLGQIDAVIDIFVERPPPSAGRHILRLMAAELLFADTAAHAAVDTAVRLAQSQGATAKLGGLVNAVGRRIADAGVDLLADQDAARLNTPGWLWERLAKDWGYPATRAMAMAHMSPAPHDLTLAESADAQALAGEIGATILNPALSPGSIRLPGRPQITAIPGYAQGAWWVQDAAAALPIRLIREPTGKRVLDLCAAPGGKTLQLCTTGAEVTALDASDTRMERLRQNLERTGQNAELITADALEWEPDRSFDAILLDAPCSASGTIRRHPDLPYRFERRSVSKLAKLQKRLLERALDWLKPGGTLVYATCSLFKAEGEDVLAHTLTKHAVIVELDPIHPDDAISEELIDPQGCIRTRPDLWPEQGGMDGFFAARLKRRP